MILNDPALWRPAVNLITFTIEGVTYKAEEGMTWYEWCKSKYNTGTFYCASLDSNIYFEEGGLTPVWHRLNSNVASVPDGATVIADEGIYEEGLVGGW